MKRFFITGCAVFTTASLCTGALNIAMVNTPLTQDFNTLASSGTSSLMPVGWVFSESLANANTTYLAGTGSGVAGDTYSFGSVAAPADRALGGLQSGTLIPTFGLEVKNQTGGTISSFIIKYIGEQWRLGTASRTVADQLVFQYSLDATTLANGIWVNVNALDFVAPTSGSVGIRDGNLSANSAPISGAVSGLSLANGATIWFRWNDFNASGADDGLAIDDFKITAVPEPSTFIAGALLALPFGLQGIRYLRNRKQVS